MDRGRAWIRAWVACAAAVVLCGCSQSGAQRGSAQPKPTAPLPGAQAIEDAMADLVSPGGPPGALVLIQSGDQVEQLLAGVSDIDTRTPMSATAPMRIASVSKAFTGAVLLDLVSRGEVELSDHIGDLVPGLPRSWHKVTLADVLAHTAGLPDYIRAPGFIADFVADPLMQRTPTQLLDYVRDQDPGFAPGVRYEYSDTDTIVAALAAEAITGKHYADLLAEVVTGPLGLAATTLPDVPDLPTTEDIAGGYIHGYAPDPENPDVRPADVSEFLNPALAWASGGMVSTAADLNTFIRAYAAGMGTPAVRAAQLSFIPGAGGPPGPGRNSSGLAIYRYQTPCGEFLGHTGNMPGYTQLIAATADGRTSVVVSVNSQVNPSADAARFEKLLAVETAALCAAVGQPVQSAPASGTASRSTGVPGA